MSDPVASTSTLTPTATSVRVRKKSKWENDDDDEPVERALKKKARKAVKTFSTSITGTPTSSGGTGSLPGSPRSVRLGQSPLPGERRTGSTIGSHPLLTGCRSVYKYERLNHIEEGSYGVVSRARDKETGDIVALKKLKMDQEKNGFPITSLREIKTLMMVGHHENIVRVREIVVGDTLTQYVLSICGCFVSS